MTELLTEKLPLVAGAVNGISKLRELILDLAVRGKLVDSVEPSSPGSKGVRTDLTAGWPFEIPENWRWCRFTDLEPSFQNGASSRGESEGVPVVVIRLADIKEGEISLDDSRTLTLSASTVQKYELVAGDILVIRVNGSADLVGRFVVCRGPLAAIPCDHFIRARFRDGVVNPSYLKIVGDSRATRAAISGLFVSTAGQKTVNQGHIGSVAIPLPPLEEQHRIVAKVDELMALCDRLEAEQSDAEAAHAKLVEALLTSLTQARDAADFRASWQQLSEHFHALFTTEASIDALEKTVLRLGVMGKLVAHVNDGESAVQLLARISGARKVQLKSGAIDESLAPYEVPTGWCWTNLPEVGELARGKSKHRPRNDPALYSGGTTPLVQTGDVARANGLVKTSTGKYNAAGVAQSRLWPAGTMCITIAANIADSAILGFDACFPDSVVGFIPGLPEINVKYFEYFLRTAKADLQKFAPSTAQKNINLDILGKLCVPLPPLAELNQIVDKVDELLTLCEQLRLRLSQVRHHHEHLAAVLVEQAVA